MRLIGKSGIGGYDHDATLCHPKTAAVCVAVKADLDDFRNFCIFVNDRAADFRSVSFRLTYCKRTA